MSLDVSKIKSLVEKQPKKGLLLEAKAHENRLAFHTQAEISQKNQPQAHNEFMSWVKSILPKDKYQRFRQLMQNPICTLTLTNEIFKELARVFDGQNSFFSYEFRTTELEQDFNEYLGKIKDREFFKTKGFDQLKCGINSVLVVDLPIEMEGSRPEPFYYFVCADDIIDCSATSSGDISHIIFKLSDTLIGAYDDEFYRVFRNIDGRLELLSESMHNLNFCPAVFFWNQNLKKDNIFLKKAPITDVLSLLDRYLFLDTSKEHADLYSSYPIVVSMEKLCNYEGCQDGMINKEKRVYNESREDYDIEFIPTKCPACSDREMVGAGTNFEYPAKQSSDDPDLSNPVSIISADVNPLQYLKEKLQKLAELIKAQVIGTGSSSIDTQAINELQVLGSFESRRNVLITIKESFEKVHKFANDTVAMLRYGDGFVGSTVFYGDEFYLKDLATLQKEYKEAKENGEPDDEIDAIYRQIIQTKYKGNKDKIKRAWMLLNINPLPHKTLQEAKELFDAGVISRQDFTIKARFNNFIARFEREQTNIIFFGENQEFDRRIEQIYEQLKIYADETEQSRTDDQTSS